MVAKLDFDLKTEYFGHLVSLVVDKKHPKVDYTPLFDLLHSIKFEIIDEKDEARVEDGAYLRNKWLDEEGIYEYLHEFDGDFVSVFEVLIALADRLSFQIGDICTGDHDLTQCFWEILGNLGLDKFPASNYKPLVIKGIIRVWMYKKTKSNGSGGPFPLKNSRSGQQFLPIWQQMNAYIMENYW